MSKIKKDIGTLIKRLDKIPDEFWIKTEAGTDAILVLDQEDGSAGGYETSQERIGITKDGKVFWGFSSGCSCWGGWSAGDYCPTMEYKEFELTKFQGNRATYGDLRDWEGTTAANLSDFLTLTKTKVTADEVLKVLNAEIRRYLIKRVGYKNIKEQVNAEVLHKDGDSELLKFANGEMYVKVKDTSTKREYLLYVEGSHKTCKSAIAWTFGLNEEEYQPLIES